MKWIMPEVETDSVLDFILQQRNIEDFDKFSNLKLSNGHSPFLLHHIDKAVNAIVKAIKNNEKIIIHGDFDVDGVTATTIMWRFLYEELKANVLPYIPNRFDEGYGLSKKSLNTILKQGGEMVITVDCGVKDIDLIKEYSAKLKFIITDHHSLAPANQFEKRDDVEIVGEYAISKLAQAVVHPKLPNYPFADLCGASVAWKLCCALNGKLKANVDMTKFLDLVALGTVCDIMPLVGENRILVKEGLKIMKNTGNVGLRALAKVSNIDIKSVNEYSLGYQLGPRINAAGRLKHAIDAVKLLSTNDESSALALASHLQKLNTQRQSITEKFVDLAEMQISKQKDDFIYFIEGESWPEGIVGLIAGKLSQKYTRPVLVASRGKKITKGSARSIASFDIALVFKKLDHLLIAHGGHTQAAGFTVSNENTNTFVEELKCLAKEYLTQDDLVNYLMIDALTNPEHIDIKLINNINKLSPFGFGNPKPVIAITNGKINSLKKFGKQNDHVEFVLTKNNYSINIIGFRMASHTFRHDYISVAGTLDIDTYKNIPVMKLIDYKQSQ
jgi:single-stranded-DNA-specific exonuclease